jgi:RNA polymerase sigma-70 factor (ECF subfamily)
MSADEAQLLGRAQAGDTDALSELLTLCGPRVRRELFDAIPARWQSVLSMDDVMQQAYAEAFVHFKKFADRGSGSFGAWLSTVAKCTLIDALRMLEADKRGGDRRQVRPMAGEDSLVSLYDMLGHTTGTPSRHAARHEATAAMKFAVEQLPTAQRQVVEMYDLQGKPVAEVAAAIGRSEGAVYLLRVRAHRRLAEIMGAPANYFTQGS